ncbi:DinB family protein [Microtetraspora sp. NBRC 13810]|uniref:DinB family protein n=1 Tax=Microtetraspora sp. NBRC 13810 TaxID=3030990 RepID=UPI002556F250|nr:DinB family protein [Microtetraspora sp. NBRC 13810]
MIEADLKADLHRYLRDARTALLWKLDGLPERDIRRPLTPTGTNLLGLVKHLTGVELLYLGHVYGRHFEEHVPWFRPDLAPDAFAPNTDMWATAEESREHVVGLYRRAWEHADATVQALGLDAVCHVPWWPAEYGRATLHRILVHMIAETGRHAGHADIVRELIDGAAGMHAGDDPAAVAGQAWWADYRSELERVAQSFGPR